MIFVLHYFVRSSGDKMIKRQNHKGTGLPMNHLAGQGEITAGRIIFGEAGVEPILGVTALESVGIIVDPVNKTLKRLPAIPLK